VSETFDLDSLTLPQDLPVSLPSRLVEQRPDVREAEAQLHAASANVGVAISNELPQFSLTAAVGAAATGFASLPGTGIWSIAGSASQTLFDAGTLLHKKRASVAALDQAAAQYRGTVIRAFQNVSDALRALQADADALAAQDAAERSAFASLELARRQFHADTIDYLTVLLAERAWEQARISRIQIEGIRYADTVALFQALGGGWWHRSDTNLQRATTR
jgi:NodT family efflux transporter outer membrane factor (OMF) lipoprotein